MEYTSCNWITHGLNFEPQHIEMCCLRCHVGNGSLKILQPYQGEKIDWDHFFELKKEFINENKSGKINPKCEGCFNLEHRDWDDEDRYFKFIHFNHWTHCNCKCKYCFTDHNKSYFNNLPHYNILPVVKDLFANNLFRPGGQISFAGGEPTILGEFEDLLNFLLDNITDTGIRIHTSGIKYSPAIARGVRESKLDVVVSLDAGYPQTFKEIKGFDCLDAVMETTRKYAEAQPEDKKNLVMTKFIMFPEYNDTIDEIETWIQNTVKAGAKAIIVDIEHEWFSIQRKINAMPDHIHEQMAYIRRRADELGLDIVLYNSARYLEENPQNFLNKEFLPNPFKRSCV